eukprot:4795638-Prymnesium_polylepis.1
MTCACACRFASSSGVPPHRSTSELPSDAARWIAVRLSSAGATRVLGHVSSAGAPCQHEFKWHALTVAGVHIASCPVNIAQLLDVVARSRIAQRGSIDGSRLGTLRLEEVYHVHVGMPHRIVQRRAAPTILGRM